MRKKQRIIFVDVKDDKNFLVSYVRYELDCNGCAFFHIGQMSRQHTTGIAGQKKKRFNVGSTSC